MYSSIMNCFMMNFPSGVGLRNQQMPASLPVFLVHIVLLGRLKMYWWYLIFQITERNLDSVYLLRFAHDPITHLNTLRPRQNGRHFPDDIFKCIVLNENVWISIKISLKFVPEGHIENIPSLIQIMAWRRQGDKSWSEPIMVRLLTHMRHSASMS